MLEWDDDVSADYVLPLDMLQLRASIALGKYDDVLAQVKSKSDPDHTAAGVAAEYFKSPSESSPAVQKAKKLAEAKGDNMNVQILCGTVLAAAGETEEALALLMKHQGSLDA